MSRPPPDQQFWDLADSFIHVANEHSDTVAHAKVSAAMLYAAARFNAFIAAANADDEVAFREDRERALEYFTGEFRKMLAENLDDWADHYTEYIRTKRGSGA